MDERTNPVESYVNDHGEYCARTVITKLQIVSIICCGILIAALICLYPLLMFYALLLGASLLSLLILLSRVWVYALGIPACRNATVLVIPDAELPIYSVLVPLYNEPQIIPGLIKALSDLDYPAERLDIQILIEEHDSATREALEQVTIPLGFRVTIVEAGKPQTKPRACDYGLALARGEFVVIFDAEDRPELDQLRKAVSEFRQRPDTCVCLQARLTHYNTKSSLAARWTDLDYLLWYAVSMNGLQRLGFPMPLGGTSNHFRIAALREVGGWDPYNVTEDCDLGLRLIRQGKLTRMLDSRTWEEAVTEIPAWIKQRSRWIKGFMQTALVHTRKRALREFGFYRFFGMLLFVPGSVLMQLAAPALFIAPLMLLLQAPNVHNRFEGSMFDYATNHSLGELFHNNEFMSSLLFIIGVLGIGLGIVVVLMHAALALIRGRSDLCLTAFSIPLAWLFLACAAWRACAELIIKPFYWAKTSHGHEKRGPSYLRQLGIRIAYASSIALATYAVSLYVIRLDLIVYTWGQQEVPPSQAPSALQQLGIGQQIRCTLQRMENEAVPTWLVLKDESVAWSQINGISALVYIDKQHTDSRQLQWELRLDDGYWFTCLDPEAVIPGRWTRLEFDLRAYGKQMKAKNHARMWDDYAYQDIEEIRLVDYTVLASIAATPAVADVQSGFSLAKPYGELAPVQFEMKQYPATEGKAAFELLEWTFSLSKAYDNPYDDALVQIDAEFTHEESGKKITHPTFFMIPYQRSQIEQHEQLMPNGAATWCLRWAAPLAGKWQATLRVTEAGNLTAEQILPAFNVSSPTHPGYIQRHTTKPYLHHTNGEFFYPIGHNVCWPIDTQQPFDYAFELPVDSGTYAYDNYFKRMGDARENWARVWMAYTWIGLEGISEWQHFDGLGQYNQAHASRLDHLMNEARKNGIYVRLTMQHYSDFSEDWGNTNWNTNPYSQRYGGPLRYAGEFLFNKQAKLLQKRRLRYIIARWGWDPQIESWELWGEVNLLNGFNERQAAIWHREMIDYIHSIDASRRPIFSHCHNWQLGMHLWSTEGLDCVQGNGYIRPPNHTPDHVINFTNYISEVKKFDKPIFMAEYGGRSEQGAPSQDYLEAQFHSGLWAGAVQPFAGIPFSWWWNFIDGENLYFHFTAVHEFLVGIDRIKRDLIPVIPRSDLGSSKLRAHGMQDKLGGIYWIYDPQIFITCKLPQIEAAKIRLAFLANGHYRCRFMDTWTGTWLEEINIEVVNQEAELKLPSFKRDIALRLDRYEP